MYGVIKLSIGYLNALFHSSLVGTSGRHGIGFRECDWRVLCTNQKLA
jgi:hypothetical protein